MDINNLTDKEIVFHHLTLEKEIDERTVAYSTLINLLKEARKACGKDIITGNDVGQSYFLNWLGIVGYFIVLDQIGKCYKPKDIELNNNGNSIKRALFHFTDLNKEEINAIAALRHSFVHDFSLINRDEKHAQNLYHFRIADEGYMPGILILLSNEPFKMEDALTFDNLTIINIERLARLIESVYHKAYDLYRIDKLDIIIKGGAKRILERYVVFTHNVED